jgi:hypothetical protein
VKTPETDYRVVDYLYDDLSDAQREAFSAVLESDEAAATEARFFATLLKIYREESDELTPSMAATERLLREAERAHRSLWSRLLGDLLPRVVLRPAVGFAMVAVLLIGGGVFFVLSQKPGPDRRPDGAHSVSRPESTVSAAAPMSAPDSTMLYRAVSKAEAAGAAGKRAEADTFADSAPNQDKGLDRAGAQSIATGNDDLYKNNKQGALATRSGRGRGLGLDRERKGLGGLRGRRSRAPAKAKKRAYHTLVDGKDQGKAAPRAPRPSASPTLQTTNALRAVQKKPVGAKQRLKESKAKTPPALHNRARMNLAKGQVAVACRMFGSLVRGHRGYSRRADAILGWARCEMARGSYNRAAQLVRKLVSEYPKWKKTGARMLVDIKRRQAQAALRAQRVRRVRRRPAPRRTRPARRAPSRRSSSY